MAPDAAPAITLTVRGPGHEARVGWAAPAEVERRAVATRPLRRSLAGPRLDLISLDEEDLGGGRHRVRLALSEQLHAGERVVAAQLLAGWRAGAPAQSLPVVNQSALPVELPSMRWATPNQLRVTRTADLRVDLLVASGHGRDLQAVAGVRFVATDGRAVNAVWQTAPTRSEAYGDGLICWGLALVASGLLEGLSAGVVTIHAEVFPFLGAVRRMGSAHSVMTDPGYGYGAESPLHVAWDPQGLRYPDRHIFIDPATGTSDPARVTVAASLAAAKVGVRAATLSASLAAIHLQDLVLPSANGFAGYRRAGDNAILTLAAGVHAGHGATAVPTGATVRECRVIVQGDPEEADPKAACVLRTAGTQPRIGYDRFLFRRFRLELTGDRLPSAVGYYHFDDMLVQAAPGLEGKATGPFSTAGWREVRNSATRTRWWRTASPLRGTNTRFGLLRAVEHSLPLAGVTVVNCVTVNDPAVRPSTVTMINSLAIAGQPALAPDQFRWNNRVFAARGRAIDFPAEAGVCLRYRVVNNLFERVGSDPQPLASLGEGSQTSAVDCLLEGNSFVGQRFNWGYNDPSSADLAAQNAHRGNHVRNNVFDWLPTKHDAFAAPTYGIRPGFTAGWQILYGVGYEADVLANRHEAAPAFRYEWPGLRAAVNDISGMAQGNLWLRYADDRSRATGGTGFGDYRPLAGSPALNRATRACAPVTGDGRTGFAAGAPTQSFV